MVTDSRQKRFGMNMQLKQRFARAKSFRLKKGRFCVDHCYIYNSGS